MKIYSISEGELHLFENGRDSVVQCGRVKEYFDTVRKMKQRDEWKTAGKGASFMGVSEKSYDMGEYGDMLRSCCVFGDSLLYSTFIDAVGGVYIKDKDGNERYLFTDGDYAVDGISCRKTLCAVSCSQGRYESHIALLDTESGGLCQLTEGFSNERHPFISRRDENIIYYTAIGYARTQSGEVTEKSPAAISAFDRRTDELTDIIQNDGFDYFLPQDDIDGNLYYIRRKYIPTRKKSNLGYDIIMFPVRIVKAIGGFLSTFSMAFGGEPLRTGGRNPAKSRAANERELFVEGNMIKAEKAMQGNDEGIIPADWTLIKRTPDGEETVLKKGVMSYFVCDSGDIVYSDGSRLCMLRGDRDEKLCRLKLAGNISVWCG